MDLKEKIKELKEFTKDSDINLTEEITTLEKRLETLENDIYSNLKPWDRVQMARHQQRPTTRSEEHTSELQSRGHLVCRLLLENKKSVHRVLYQTSRY